MSHVESVAVSLGHLLLKLLIITEPKETRKREMGGGGSQEINSDPSNGTAAPLSHRRKWYYRHPGEVHNLDNVGGSEIVAVNSQY